LIPDGVGLLLIPSILALATHTHMPCFSALTALFNASFYAALPGSSQKVGINL
jgi:MFS superfamily sulfate permease-like transporter